MASWSRERFSGGRSGGSAHAPRREGSRSPDSSSSCSNGPGVHPEVAHILAGETRFPSSMSYMSENQRSDVATVDSGSAVEDVDVESLHSRDGIHHHHHFHKQENGGESTAFARTGRGSLHEPSKHRKNWKAGSIDGGESQNTCNMAQSKESRRPSTEPAATGENEGCDKVIGPYESLSLSKGAGHGSGGDSDGVGSLDVEDHSVGSRSIPSQEDTNPDTGGVPMGQGAVESVDNTISSSLLDSEGINPLLDTETPDGGRRSPGGTIYKGRGTRRYQGRSMHLPLKRFHEGTSDIQAQFSSTTHDETKSNKTDIDHAIPGYDHRVSLDDLLRHRRNGRSSDASVRHRERSRSRSPPDTDHENDKKPPAL